MDWSIDAAGCTLGWVCVESGPAWTSLPANSGSSASNLMGPGFMLRYLSAKSLARRGPVVLLRRCAVTSRHGSRGNECPHDGLLNEAGDVALGVSPQEVVPGQAESADGR